MEINEISMYIEVKVDISDKKKESRKLKNWSNCLVKVEAIKSFPCFLRITVLQNVDNDWQNLCIPIHVPGVQIRLTNSRSKSFSYGLTWKHNRKRSYIFFAFDSGICFERHMRWLKDSLKNLELHRREILETRRRNRESCTFMNTKRKLSLKDKKTLQDILGPLPKIPDKRDSMNLSRRLSAISGIYEEIIDSEKIRRISQASGIYEEMKPHLQTNISPLQNNSPPELPIRSRINTFETDFYQSIKRCNTNPDVVMASKNQDFLQNIQNNSYRNRSKRSESVSEYIVCKVENLIDKPKSIGCLLNYNNKKQVHIYQNVNSVTNKSTDKLGFNDKKLLQISKSNPNLSEIKHAAILPIKYSKHKSVSAPSIYNISSFLENIYDKKQKFKIESVEKITSDIKDKFNFVNKNNSNFSFFENQSKTNLKRSKVSKEKLRKLTIDDVSGYCTMAPIKSTYKYSELNFNQISDGSKSVHQCQKIINSNKANHANFSQTRANNETGLIRLYKNESVANNKDSNFSLPNITIQNYITPKESTIDEKINNSNKENHGKLFKSKENNEIGLRLCKNKGIDNDKSTQDCYIQKKTLVDIDEKISSYYHNFNPNKTEMVKNKFLDLNNQIINKQSSTTLGPNHYDSSVAKQPPTTLGSNYYDSSVANNCLYVSSPKKRMKQKIKKTLSNLAEINHISQDIQIQACKVSENCYSVNKSNDHSFIDSSQNNDQGIFSTKLLEKPVNSIISFESLLQSIDFKFDDLNDNDLTVKNHLKVSNSNPKHLIGCNIKNKNSEYNNDNVNYEKNFIEKKITVESSSIKKITLLPRFKKIDFSPLKTKISNVLQRNFVD